MTKIEVTEELRQAVIEAVAGALGGCAYDCTRVWSAWSYGTMSQDDFLDVRQAELMLAQEGQAGLHQLVVVRFVAGGAAQLGDAGTP